MKVILVHWNEAESKERAKKLRGAGYRVERLEPGTPPYGARHKTAEVYRLGYTVLSDE